MTKRTLTLCSIIGGFAISAASVFAQGGAGGGGSRKWWPESGAGAGGIGAGTAGSASPTSPANSQGTLPQPNQNSAGTTGSGTGSPFSDPATRSGSNMPSNPGAPANRMDNNTNTNPFPGPATGNPNAGARNGINPDSALNRGAGIDARTPDQRAAALIRARKCDRICATSAVMTARQTGKTIPTAGGLCSTTANGGTGCQTTTGCTTATITGPGSIPMPMSRIRDTALVIGER